MRMTVKDLMKVCSEEDCVCVYDVATDTYLYDSYLNGNSTHDDVDDNVLCMTVRDVATGNQFGLVITVDTENA